MPLMLMEFIATTWYYWHNWSLPVVLTFRLDIYRKIPKDLTQPTKTGACISVASCIFIAYLFFSELMSYLKSELWVTQKLAQLGNQYYNGHLLVMLAKTD